MYEDGLDVLYSTMTLVQETISRILDDVQTSTTIDHVECLLKDSRMVYLDR